MALFKPQTTIRVVLLAKEFPSLIQESIVRFSTVTASSRFVQFKFQQPHLRSGHFTNTNSNGHNFLCADHHNFLKKANFISELCKFSTSTRRSSVDDNESKGFQVYEGRVKGLLKRVKIFSLMTSVIGVGFQPYLWFTMQDMSLLFAAPLFTAVNFFVFANPMMIHYLAKRYVNELHYNPKSEKYTATVLSFFARKQTFTFTADDVTVPEIPGLFAMLTAKGRPLFVDHRDFTSVDVYKKMMGFDKPLDLTYSSEGSQRKD